VRILFVTRADAFENRGGDTIQLEKTAEQLRRLGHVVDVAVGTRFARPAGFDLVHIFNMQRVGETAAQVRRARSRPIAISPIYADTTALDRGGRSRMRKLLATLVPEPLVEIGKQLRRVLAGAGQLNSIVPLLSRSPSRLRKWTLRQCGAVLPNSEWERAWLETLISPTERGRLTVVPNGVDASLIQRGQSGDDFRSRFGVSDDRFVLSVARFDERKNNLRLIEAAKAGGFSCVLVGRPAPLHLEYFERCRKAADGARVRIVDQHLSQEELAGAYRADWVHALPSWLETPGLSTLEAGLFGANAVVGECPAVREYLGDHAWYCRPGDVSDIKLALQRAIEASRNHYKLDEIVRAKFSWSHIGTLQVRIYEKLVNSTIDSSSFSDD
jgi:glycosyltransferase involved in cell wall biosynthesis